MWTNSFFTLLVLAFSLLVAGPAQAIITSISAPTTKLHPGHKFNVTFHTSGHIINNAQYYTLFGVLPQSSPYLVMGTLLNQGFDLVTSGHSQTGVGSFNVTIEIPKGFKTVTGKTQKYVLNVGVFGTVCFLGLV
jgi:hypothetical protein